MIIINNVPLRADPVISHIAPTAMSQQYLITCPVLGLQGNVPSLPDLNCLLLPSVSLKSRSRPQTRASQPYWSCQRGLTHLSEGILFAVYIMCADDARACTMARREGTHLSVHWLVPIYFILPTLSWLLPQLTLKAAQRTAARRTSMGTSGWVVPSKRGGNSSGHPGRSQRQAITTPHMSIMPALCALRSTLMSQLTRCKRPLPF